MLLYKCDGQKVEEENKKEVFVLVLCEGNEQTIKPQSLR